MYEIQKLKILEKFGLRKNHLRLMAFFLKNISKKFSVKEISKRTEIPLSRIYPFLNSLHRMGLISKVIDRKTFFFMDDPQTRVRRFLNQKEMELKNLQKILLNELSDLYTSQDFVVIKSNKEMWQTSYQIRQNSRYLKLIEHHPRLILMRGNSSYWEKEVRELTKKQIEEENFELYDLVDINFFKEKSVQSNKPLIIGNIQWLQRKENVHLKTIDLTNVPSMIITEKEVMIGFRNPIDRRNRSALLFRSTEFHNFFERFYDDLFQRAKEIDTNQI